MDVAPHSAEPLARSRRPGGARERLLGAALERFGDAGPVAVSLDEVRQNAGVSVGALYHHFTDKTMLLDTLYLEQTEDFQRGFLEELRAHPDAQDAIEAGVRFYLRWVTHHRAGASLLLSYRPHNAALAERNRSFFAEAMGWWGTHVHYGTLRALPFDLIHALWLGPSQEYTRHWIAGHANRTPDRAADTLAQAAWITLKEPR